MKFGWILAFTFFSILFTSKARAQTNLLNSNDLSQVNIDDYSDEQLSSMLQKANESGLSETQLLQLAADRGLPQSELIKLQDRLEKLAQNYLGNSVEGSSHATLRDTALLHFYDSTASRIPSQQNKIDRTIFGSELFTSNSLVFEPNLRIPAPAGYLLGPDDEILVNVYGYSEKNYTLKVDEHGEVFIPNVGPILVNGLTLEKAGEKIQSILSSTIYHAIKTGQTKVEVSLGKIKSIRVTVIGQAQRPGSYTVSSLTTLYNILFLCGGPTSMGSYRDIQIIRADGEKRNADLYKFLVNGNQSDNILLQEGDVIRIPYYKNRVEISGNVKRTGKFEMLDSETFNDLLHFCGGFDDDAYRSEVSVARISDSDRIMIDLPASDYGSFKAHGSDKYYVRKLRDVFGNRIVISGSVQRPGPYELTPNLTVKELVAKAGGITRDAYTRRATIFRYTENKLPTALSLNLDSVLEYNQRVFLKRDDSLYIHSVLDFSDSSNINVEGIVRHPGTIPWRKNLTLNDALMSVGGIAEGGDSSNIEITRRILNADVEKSNYIESKVLVINIGKNNIEAGDIPLSPYDLVIVKMKPGYSAQRTVLVTGEIKSPGRYGLELNQERLSDLLKRVGGFKASADSSTITIRRSNKSNLTTEEKEKLFQRVLNINPDSIAQNVRIREELNKTYDLISVDLKEVLAHPGGPEDLALEDGDILTVDRNTNLVKISGEVYYPTIVPYKNNKNLKYYVLQAGNFTFYARKSGSIVIQSDGKAKSVKHFLWFKFYPKVQPRSEIFVPEKQRANRSKLSIGEFALLVSSLGIIVNVLKL
jgi:protein involved in polysaccharide export with SLBB domain